MKKALALFLVLTLSLAALAGFAGAAGEVKAGGTLIVGLPGDPATYNPAVGMDEAGGLLYYQLFNNLAITDGDYNIIPDLADSWEYNEDFTKLTFYLHEGVKWHDGTDFTSADVKWTMETIIAEFGTLAPNLSSVASIETPDALTVVFETSTPDAVLLSSLTYFGGSIMPKHIYEGTDWLTNPANQNPVGTGPFRFVNSRTGVSVELAANSDYFREGPYLDRIMCQIVTDPETEYQMWQNGEIDVMYNQVPGTDFTKYDGDPNYTSRFSLMANRNYFTFHLEKEDNPFADLRLRQAFNLALNREQILNTGLKGNGALAEYYISPKFEWALNDDIKIPAQNIEQARALLEEAGYTADANGVYLSVQVDYFMFDEVLVVAQANLLEAGIDIQLNKLEINAWIDKTMISGDYDVTILGGDQGPDVSSIGMRIGTGSTMNLARYSNPRVDELLALGTSAADHAQRAPYYQELQEVLAEDLPIIICNDVGYKTIVTAGIRGVPMADDTVRPLVPRYSYAMTWIDN